MNKKTDNTIRYYDQNAKVFAESTKDVDMTHLYAPFLKFLPSGSRILDAGCGSGRDLKYFRELGYQAYAFDASQELCVIASKHSGIEVVHASFASYEASTESFDGIWACASLLHISQDQLPGIFKRLARMLKPRGVLYASFKTLVDETQAGERYFCSMNNESLSRLIDTIPSLKIYSCWNTKDARPDREDQWINALIIKESI